MQREQLQLPADLRTPHFIDAAGNLKPYPKKVLDLHRKQSQVPIPSSEPTYEEWKSGQARSKGPYSKKKFDIDEIHPELQEEILGDDGRKVREYSFADDVTPPFEKPAPLLNVLDFDVK